MQGFWCSCTVTWFSLLPVVDAVNDSPESHLLLYLTFSLYLRGFLPQSFFQNFFSAWMCPSGDVGESKFLKQQQSSTNERSWWLSISAFLLLWGQFFLGQFELCSIFFHYVASGMRSTVAIHQSLTKWVILNPLTLELGDIWMILGGLLAFTIGGMSCTSLPPKGGAAYPIKSKGTFQ